MNLHYFLPGFLLFCFSFLSVSLSAQVTGHTLATLPVRDPYILPDPATKSYFLYKSTSTTTSKGEVRGGVSAYRSVDLIHWQGPYPVFSVPENNWITGAVWAPEVHYYKGRYYLFATLNSSVEWKKALEGWPKFTFRGTQIFHSDSPLGPFLPFSTLPHTPSDRMALDGTFWVGDGVPYMIYCHEWVQVTDGTFELVKLAPDLSSAVSESRTLFCASAAQWSTGSKTDPVSYVSDGCFVYRTKLGKLLMIWSSFQSEKYAIGIAESMTGKITGPWRQQEKPLFNEDGGHGMIFRGFDGRLWLALHGPNSPGGSERARLFELEDTGETVVRK